METQANVVWLYSLSSTFLKRRDGRNAAQSSTNLGRVCCFRSATLDLEDNNLSSDSLSQSSEDTHSLHFWYIRETIKFKVRCWLVSVTFLSTKIWFTIGRLIWRWNYSSISGGRGSSQDTLELPQSLVKHLAFHTPWSQNSQWIKTEVMMDRTSHLVDISCFLEWMLIWNWSLLQTVCQKSPKALTISSLPNSHGSCVSLCWEGSTSRMPGRLQHHFLKWNPPMDNNVIMSFCSWRAWQIICIS
jgi:hypothetical protein